mgnify:CR=1 FL=1
MGIGGGSATAAQGLNKTNTSSKAGKKYNLGGKNPSGKYSSHSRALGNKIGTKWAKQAGRAIGRVGMKAAGVIGAGAGAWAQIAKCANQLRKCRKNCYP